LSLPLQGSQTEPKVFVAARWRLPTASLETHFQAGKSRRRPHHHSPNGFREGPDARKSTTPRGVEKSMLIFRLAIVRCFALVGCFVKGFNPVEYRIRPSGPVVQPGMLTSVVRPKNVRFANQLMVQIPEGRGFKSRPVHQLSVRTRRLPDQLDSHSYDYCSGQDSQEVQ